MREVAQLCCDGGRENAVISPFLTTPQSPLVTAPLTRGAKTNFFYTLKPPKRGFFVCFFDFTQIIDKQK